MANLTANGRFTTFIRREDDGEYHIIAVIDMNSNRVARILRCENHEEPEDETIAYDVAVAYQYAGLGVPQGVFNMLGNRLPTDPPRRRVYTCCPWDYSTNSVDNFVRQRDNAYQLLPNMGSLGHPGDHRLDVQLSRDIGFPGSVEIDPPTEIELQASVTALEDQVDTLTQERDQARTDLAAAVQRATIAEANLAMQRQMVTDLQTMNRAYCRMVSPESARRVVAGGGGDQHRHAGDGSAVRRQLEEIHPRDDDGAESDDFEE